jgi:hypothetical protein
MANSSTKFLKRYGEPEPTLQWESKHLVLWDVPDDINRELPVIPNKIYCNKDLVKPLEAVFRDLIKAYKAGELKPLDSLMTWDGCYNIRKKRGLSSLSVHSYGMAVDVNAFRNGLGKTPTFSDAFAKIWEKHGFIWGGRWSRLDGMHFELDLDRLPK